MNRHLVLGIVGVALVAQTAPKAKYQPRMVQPGIAQRVSDDDGTVFRPAPGPRPDQAPPGAVPAGSSAAAERQTFILEEAARTLSGGSRLPDDPTITGAVLSPVIDARTGMVKEDAENLDARIHNKPEPNAPNGRRARLAELAGISPEEAAKLFPIPEESKPYAIRDIHTTDPAQPATSQEDVVRRLAPGQRPDREELVRNSVLTDAEASFAVNAALGLPFPIRVGKVDLAGTTSDGLVLYGPDLLRADPLFDQWPDLQVTYRYMHNEEEVYKDTVHVRPFTIIPRPTSPVTHLWVTCDKDVMIYAMRGTSRIPRTIEEARAQVQNEVVPVNSWLRVPTKIFGIRWGLLPTVDELTKNPATRERLARTLNETGLLKQNLAGEKDQSPMVEEFRQMADKLKKSGTMPNRPK